MSTAAANPPAPELPRLAQVEAEAQRRGLLLRLQVGRPFGLLWSLRVGVARRQSQGLLLLGELKGWALPLASGLLTGKMSATSTFAADDHRSFNRNGEAFDKGETFSGVPYDVALAAVEELRALVPAGATMAAFALRWILMQDAVSIVIPGAKSPAQSQANVLADSLPALSRATLDAAREVYARLIAPHVAHLW